MKTENNHKKLKTQLESTGAEYLILGELLVRRIQAFITSQNFESYDIVAVNPEKNLATKIQVKSRYNDTDCGFSIKKTDTDFVVFVRLRISESKKTQKLDYSNREIYILPMDVILKYRRQDDWNKCHIRKIPDFEKYKDNWDLIKEKLK